MIGFWDVYERSQNGPFIEEQEFDKYQSEMNERAVMATKYANLPGADGEHVARQLEAGAERIRKLQLQVIELDKQLVKLPNAALFHAKAAREKEDARAAVHRQDIAIIRSVRRPRLI